MYQHSLKAVQSREDQIGLKVLLYTLDIYQVAPMTQSVTNLHFLSPTSTIVNNIVGLAKHLQRIFIQLENGKTIFYVGWN